MQSKAHMQCEEYVSLFEGYGETDADYLRIHYARMCETQNLFYKNNTLSEGARLLDVGAHWLHQSLLYAQDGYKVTAADFPVTLEKSSVKKMAEDYSMKLFSCHDISHIDTFKDFPDNSFDIILFTEFLEHITFNPINLWKGLYRILSPGGKIIITTPNYYYYKPRIRGCLRLLTRMGGGISINEILNIKTYGHHWKEYSAQEIQYYFQSLSNDFVVKNLAYTPLKSSSKWKLKAMLTNTLSMLFRPGIYVEVELVKKKSGITIAPSW